MCDRATIIVGTVAVPSSLRHSMRRIAITSALVSFAFRLCSLMLPPGRPWTRSCCLCGRRLSPAPASATLRGALLARAAAPREAEVLSRIVQVEL